MWVWVIVVLASLVVLAVLILCVPVDAVLTLDTSAERRFRVRLVWLFGLVRPEFGPKRRGPRQPGRAKRKRGIGLRTIWRILRTRGLLTRIKNLARDVLSQIKIREIAVNLRLGLDDPADAGLVFAIIGMAKPFIKLPRQYDLTIEPSFSGQPFFQGYVQGVLRLQPIRLVIPFGRFIFSATTLRGLRILASSRR